MTNVENMNRDWSVVCHVEEGLIGVGLSKDEALELAKIHREETWVEEDGCGSVHNPRIDNPELFFKVFPSQAILKVFGYTEGIDVIDEAAKEYLLASELVERYPELELVILSSKKERPVLEWLSKLFG